MKKIYLLLFLLIALLTFNVGCNRNYTLTEEDKILIANTVNDYYSALENGDFKKALACLNFDKNRIKMFEFSNREKALEELRKYIDYKVSLVSLSKNISKSVNSLVNRTNNRNLYWISAEVRVESKPGTSVIHEVLYLEKVDNKWLISVIESFDKYVILRSSEYYYVDTF